MNIKAFDVILVNFGKVEFDGEQAGIRPAIVIQNELGNSHSCTTIVIPTTTKMKNANQATHTLFKKGTGGLCQDSMLLGECVRQISDKRILKKIGNIDNLSDKLELKRIYLANFAEV